jgi:hypothetical protein
MAQDGRSVRMVYEPITMPEKCHENNGVTVFIVWGVVSRSQAIVGKNVLTNGTEESKI